MSLVNRFKSIFNSKLDVHARFESLREAVSGTMSKFHMARDRKTGVVYGLKVLDAEKTRIFEDRFPGLNKPSEGEIASEFIDPLIVKTIEYGLTTADEPYLLMEFLDGLGMNSLIIQRSGLLEGKRVSLIRQMARSIAIVHEAGYIHRDICPRNFICSKDAATLKLIDFGLTVPSTKEFMMPGNRTGTPNYMAPEIVRRRATDHRVDIFSFGVTAYQLCSFQLPWGSQDTSGKAAMSHDTRTPVPLSQWTPDLDPRLTAAIMQCISVKPEDRPASIERFLQQIRPVQSEF